MTLPPASFFSADNAAKIDTDDGTPSTLRHDSPTIGPATDKSGPAANPTAYVQAIDALSANTIRALRADLARYRAWCSAHGAADVPAQAATVAAFIDEMAELRAPATVRRYVASIAFAHRSAGHATPTHAVPVRHALQRMHRKKGRRQKQALGLNWTLRQRLMAAAGDRLIDRRNRALLAIAYDAMLRRSELVAARVSDLAPHVDGGATLMVHRAKTDTDGRSATVYVARDSSDLILDWLQRSEVRDGHLFRSVTRGGEIGERLHPSQVPRIFKAMARAAGLPPNVVACISGHSARVGAAQDMIAAGIEMPAILQAGRWRTVAMASRYGERLLPGRSAAAQLARLQRR